MTGKSAGRRTGFPTPLRAGGVYILSIGLFLVIFFLSPGGSPSENFPRITVETRHSYGDELIVEREITAPLENALFSLPGITGLESVSRRGLSRIECGFARDKDRESAYPLARAAVNRVAAGFGSGIGNPLILRTGGREPIFIAAIPGSDDRRRDTLLETFRAAGECGEIRIGGASTFPVVLAPADPGSSVRYAPAVLPPLLRGYLLEGEGRWTRRIEPFSSLPIAPGTGIGDLYEVRREAPRPSSEGRINGEPVFVVSVFPGKSESQSRTVRNLRSAVDSIPGASVIYSSRKKTVSTLLRSLIPFILIIAGFQIIHRLSGSLRRLRFRALLFVFFQCTAALAVCSLLGRPFSRGHFGGIAAGIGISQYILFILSGRLDAIRRSLVPVGIVVLLFLPEAVFLSSSPRGGSPLGLGATLLAYFPCAAVLPLFRSPAFPIPPKRVYIRIALCIAGISGILPFLTASPGAAGWDRILSGSICLPAGTPYSAQRSILIPWETRLLRSEGIDRVVLSIDEERTRFYLRFSRGIPRRRAELMFHAATGELERYFFPDWEADRGNRAVITVHGPETDKLAAIAEAAALAGTGAGGGTKAVFHYAESPSALLLSADPEKLALSGTDLFSLYISLFWRYSEGVAGKFAPPEEEGLVDILIRSEEFGNPLRREALTARTVDLPGGKLPLLSVADLREKPMPGIIFRRGTRRYTALSVYGPRGGGFVRSLRNAVSSLPIPPGYGISLEFSRQSIPVPPEDLIIAGLLAAVSLCTVFRLLHFPGALGLGSLLGSTAGVSLLFPALASTAVFLVVTPLTAIYSASLRVKNRPPGTKPKASPGIRRLPSAS
ncbi:MAG: efflux RND transporter permease subunit [Spirochaetia bacterium]